MIIWHSRTGASKALAKAAAEGAATRAVLKRADEVEPADFLACAAYLFVCPENLAAMSGLMKEMFDRCYYPLLGRIEARGYATIIAAGSDGEGAQRQIDRIVTGWRLKRIAAPMIAHLNAQTPQEILSPKHVDKDLIMQSIDLARGIVAGLDMGIY